jgi:hypothetical protein
MKRKKERICMSSNRLGSKTKNEKNDESCSTDR